MKVVVDHLSGSRRGQRQEFAAASQLRFGRHPECDVSFDAARDLDASSQHAELVITQSEIRLRDVGSSNGTFVGGERVTDSALVASQPVVVTFGPSGPQIRLWVGPDDAPPPPTSQSFALPEQKRIWFGAALAVVAVIVGTIVYLLAA